MEEVNMAVDGGGGGEERFSSYFWANKGHTESLCTKLNVDWRYKK